jgi:small neutral amino acid transporter SnatA (MarC family)
MLVGWSIGGLIIVLWYKYIVYTVSPRLTRLIGSEGFRES